MTSQDLPLWGSSLSLPTPVRPSLESPPGGAQSESEASSPQSKHSVFASPIPEEPWQSPKMRPSGILWPEAMRLTFSIGESGAGRGRRPVIQFVGRFSSSKHVLPLGGQRSVRERHHQGSWAPQCCHHHQGSASEHRKRSQCGSSRAEAAKRLPWADKGAHPALGWEGADPKNNAQNQTNDEPFQHLGKGEA